MAGPLECPNCGLWSSPGAVRCDCGYNFTTRTLPPDAPTRPPADLGLGLFRFLPLIVWGIVSLVPPQIAAVASFLWTSFGISIGYEVRGVAGFIEGLAFSVVIAAGNWPFPILYFVTRWFARKRWPQVGLIKAAMWGSTIAMSIPNVVIFLATPSELLSGPAYDRGQGTGMLVGLEAIFLPVAGVIEWTLGYLAAVVWTSFGGRSNSGV
jgi:hypothetical protein